MLCGCPSLLLRPVPLRCRVASSSEQESVRAFEGVTTDQQRSKFHKWVDSNREAVDQLDDPLPPPPSASDIAGSVVGHTSETSSLAATAAATTARSREGDSSGLSLDVAGVATPADRGDDRGVIGSGVRRPLRVCASETHPATRGREFVAEWANVGDSRVRSRAGRSSPQFRFRGQDGNTSGGDDGMDVGAGAIGGSIGESGAAPAFSMDQSP